MVMGEWRQQLGLYPLISRYTDLELEEIKQDDYLGFIFGIGPVDKFAIHYTEKSYE